MHFDKLLYRLQQIIQMGLGQILMHTHVQTVRSNVLSMREISQSVSQIIITWALRGYGGEQISGIDMMLTEVVQELIARERCILSYNDRQGMGANLLMRFFDEGP